MTKVLETDSLTETQENWDCTKRVPETGLSPFSVLPDVDHDFLFDDVVVEYDDFDRIFPYEDDCPVD